MICVFMKRDTDTQGRKPNEGGRDWSDEPQPKNTRGYQQPPESRSGKEVLFPGALEESKALLIPWLWIASLQNCERVDFYCFKTPNLCNLNGSPNTLLQVEQEGFSQYKQKHEWNDENDPTKMKNLLVLFHLSDKYSTGI